MNINKYQEVLHEIDAFNRQDPKDQEIAYSESLSKMVQRLNPKASEALQIAARGQHIGRWTVPRNTYPEGRGGYLRWREDLKKFHAKKVGEIMGNHGYDPDEIQTVMDIILKKNRDTNADSQTMEDAVSLVFLEEQYLEFKKKTELEKMKDILRKTWRKMSPHGQAMALKLNLPPDELKFIKTTLES